MRRTRWPQDVQRGSGGGAARVETEVVGPCWRRPRRGALGGGFSPLAAEGQAREGLEHDPMGQEGGHVGMVVGWRDLHDLQAAQLDLPTDPPDRSEELTRSEP